MRCCHSCVAAHFLNHVHYSSQCEPHIILFDKYEIEIFVYMETKCDKITLCNPMYCHGTRALYVRRFPLPNNFQFVILWNECANKYFVSDEVIGLMWKKFWRTNSYKTVAKETSRVEPNHFTDHLNHNFFLCTFY